MNIRIPELSTVLHAVAVVCLLVVVVPFVVHAAPQTVGADHSYVVLSGSMEPSIAPGDVVVVAESSVDTVRVGDVISFEHEGDRKPTTHRVAERTRSDGETRLVTRGDANDAPDPRPVGPDELIGETVIVIPYIGYVIRFVNRPLGTALLVAVPLALLVLNEVVGVVRANSSETPDASTADEDETVEEEIAETDSADDSPDEIEFSAADLQATLVALGGLAAYSAAVGYVTQTAWSVAVAVGAAGTFLFAAALRRRAAPDSEQPTTDDRALSSFRVRSSDILPSDETRSLTDGGETRGHTPIGSLPALLDLAVETERPVVTDGTRYAVSTTQTVFVYDSGDGDPETDPSSPDSGGDGES